MKDLKPGRWPSPAIVISLLAIVLALSGTATAAGLFKIKKASQLGKGVVLSSAISDRAGVAPQDLAGSAVAVNGNTGPRGANGPRGGAGPVGDKGLPGDGASTLWAVVEPSGGSLRKTSHVEDTFAGNPPTNRYTINFDKNISQCEIGVTIDGGPPDGPGQAVLSRPPNTLDQVYVYTYDPAGNPARRGFHIVIDCVT